MVKAQKNLGQKQDQSAQFTFTRPVKIKDVTLCSFNPKFTGSNIGVKSIMISYQSGGSWTFLNDGSGQKKVFTLANNHTSVDIPLTSVVRLYPVEWGYGRPHIYLPAFKGC